MSARAGRPQSSHRPYPIRGDVNWLEHAQCVGHPPELFDRPETAREALAVCKPCPVKEPCEELRGGATGVWAGRAYYPPRRRMRSDDWDTAAVTMCLCSECGQPWRAHTLFPEVFQAVTRVCPDCLSAYPLAGDL